MPESKTVVRIRPAMTHDENWIKEIYKAEKKHLGSFNLYQSWERYLEGFGNFNVVPTKAFIRYNWSPKYGAYVVQEIAVHNDCKRQGLANLLIRTVPLPIMLKCNKDNEVGNQFYLSIGMQCAGRTETKNGREQIIWTCAGW